MQQQQFNSGLSPQKGIETLLENSTDAIFALNIEWQFIYVNKQAEKQLFKTREELIGNNIWVVFPRLLNTTFETYYHKAMDEQVPIRFEEFFLPFDAWFEVRVFPFEGGLTVYFRDISDIKRAMAELKDSNERLLESEKKFRQLFNNANDAIFLHGYLENEMPDKFIEVNDTACEIFGYSKEEFLKLSPMELEGQESNEELKETSKNVVRSGNTTFERILALKNGQKVPFELNTHIFELNGRTMALSIARNIAERKRVEQDIMQAYREIREIFDLAADGMCVINKDFEVVRANETFAKLCGMDKEKLIGMKCYHLLWGESCLNEKCGLQQILRGKERLETEIEKVNIKGQNLTCSVNIIPYKDNEGNIIGIIESIKDITEKKQTENLIKHMAYHDSLTDLPNRRLFNENLTIALREADAKIGKKVGIIFLDLDKFKNINDTLGHEIGDKLLKQIANRLKLYIGDDTLVARMGGDEFILLIPEMDSDQDMSKVLDSVNKVFSRPWVIENNKLEISASMGGSVYPSDGKDAVTLLKNADIAMYQAKALGGDNFQKYTSELHDKVTVKLAMETNLRHALEREEFLLHYQPQVNVVTGKIIGMEALVRWQKGDVIISPEEFIPVAEETGLIIPIGEWVLKTACKQNMDWQKAGYKPVPVAVNLSPNQFKKADLAQTVKKVIQDTGLDPRWLELEITETAVMHDAEFVLRILKDLKKLGLKILIDDFGTGYSSLGFLKRFPIDGLKIDRSFIRDITIDKNDEAIVKAIIALARSLNFDVIAEGVETKKHLNLIKKRKCTKMQGYLFGKPMPAQEFERVYFSGKFHL